MGGRPDWPGTKAATAIRAYVAKNFFHAAFAESAFEGADHGFARIRGQRLVAVFAGGS